MLNTATIIFLFFSAVVHADITVSGTVQDSKSGRPIPLVNILDEVSGIGTISAENGSFNLSSSEQDHMEIRFKHIAYDAHYQIFNSSDTGVTVSMRETLLQMNEIGRASCRERV